MSDAHHATIKASEGERQRDRQAAERAYRAAGYHVSAYAAHEAAMREADVRHFRRVLASARLHRSMAGLHDAVTALRALGAPEIATAPAGVLEEAKPKSRRSK